MRALHDGCLIDDYTLSQNMARFGLEDADRHLYAEGWAGTPHDYFKRPRTEWWAKSGYIGFN